MSAPTGVETIDATDRVVTPGFVDVHTHYDAQVFWDPDDPVAAPRRDHRRRRQLRVLDRPIGADGVGLLARTLQHVEDMSLDTLTVGVPWDEFETFGEYSRRGRAAEPGAQLRLLHRALRCGCGRWATTPRARPTADELTRMRDAVAEAIAAGSDRLATSAPPTHNGDRGRPVPSRRADLDEAADADGPLRCTRVEASWRCCRAACSPTSRSSTSTGDRPTVHLDRFDDQVSPPRVGRHRRARRGLGGGVDVAAGVVPAAGVPQMNLAVHPQHRDSFRELMMDRGRRAPGRLPTRSGASGACRDLDGEGFIPFNYARFAVAESDRHPSSWAGRARRRAVEQGCSPLDVLNRPVAGGRPAHPVLIGAGQRRPLMPSSGCSPRRRAAGLADSGSTSTNSAARASAPTCSGTGSATIGVMPIERAVHKADRRAGSRVRPGRPRVLAGSGGRRRGVRPGDVAPGPLRRVVFPGRGRAADRRPAGRRIATCWSTGWRSGATANPPAPALAFTVLRTWGPQRHTLSLSLTSETAHVTA